MQTLIPVLFLVLAAGCATLSPLPPKKAATPTEPAHCAALEEGSIEKRLCLYQALAAHHEIEKKELEAKIAALEAKKPVRQPQRAAPAPTFSVNTLGRIQPQLVQTDPTTTKPASGQGIVIENISWAVRGWDSTLVACVIRTNGPQQVIGNGVMPIFLDPDGQGVIPVQRGCARADSSIYIADVPPGERVTIMYARPTPGYIVAGRAVYQPVVSRQYDWVGTGWKHYSANEGWGLR